MNKNKKIVKAAAIGLAALTAAPMILTSAMTVKAAEKKSTDQIVAEVMAGKWGNGADRKDRLTAAGYDYSVIQTAVNSKGTSIAQAAASVKKSKIDNRTRTALRKLFDATAYAEMYPDVVKVYGNNPDKLFNHFITYGIYELRQPSYTFNVNAYASSYDDLEKAFGNDVVAYYRHYVTFGSSESESRTLTTISAASLAGKTVYSISGMTKGATFRENADKAASEGTVMTVVSTPAASTPAVSTPAASTPAASTPAASESNGNGNAYAQRYALWLANEPQRATYMAGTTYEADYTAWENSEPVRSNYVVSKYATQEAATAAYETAHNTWEAATPKVETYLAGTSYSADLATWNASKPQLADFDLMEATVDGNKMILHSTAADISEAYGYRVKDGYIEIDGSYYKLVDQATAAESTVKSGYIQIGDNYYEVAAAEDATERVLKDGYVEVDGAYHKIAIATDALTTTINDGYISLNGSYYKIVTEAEATERVVNDGYVKVDGAYYYVMPESEATYYATNEGYYIFEGNYVKECTEAEATEVKLKDSYIKVGDRYYVTVGEEEATTTTLGSGYYCDGSNYYLIEDEAEHMVVTTNSGYVKDAEGVYHVISDENSATHTVIKDGYIEIDEIVDGVVNAQKYYAIASAEEACTTKLKDDYIKIGESYYEKVADEYGTSWKPKDYYKLVGDNTFIYMFEYKSDAGDAENAYGENNYYEETNETGTKSYYKIYSKNEATEPSYGHAYDEISGKYYSTLSTYQEEDVTTTVVNEGYTSSQEDGVTVYYKNTPVAASVATKKAISDGYASITVGETTTYYSKETVSSAVATTSSLAENYVEINVDGTAKCYNKTATVDAATAMVTTTNTGYAYDETSGKYYDLSGVNVGANGLTAYELKDGYTTVDGIFYQVATEAEAVKSRTLKEEYAYDSASGAYYWTVQTYDASIVSGNDDYIEVDGCYYVKCSKEEATEEVIPNDGYGIYTNEEDDTTVYYNANCASLTDACESYTLADGFSIVNGKVYRTATESDAMALEVKSGYMYDEDYDCYCKSADKSEAAQLKILNGYAVTEDGTYYCINGEPVRFEEALENAAAYNTEYETLKDGYVKIGYNYYKTVTEATATTVTGELNEGYAKEGDIYYAATAVDESTATTTSLKDGYGKDTDNIYYETPDISEETARETAIAAGYAYDATTGKYYLDTGANADTATEITIKDGYAATENGYRESAESDPDNALDAYLKDGYVFYENGTYKVVVDGDDSIESYYEELENWNNSEPNQDTYLAGTSYASDVDAYLAAEPDKDQYKVGYATEEAATEAFNADKAAWDESKPSEDTYIDSTSYQSDRDAWEASEPTE